MTNVTLERSENMILSLARCFCAIVTSGATTGHDFVMVDGFRWNPHDGGMAGIA